MIIQNLFKENAGNEKIPFVYIPAPHLIVLGNDAYWDNFIVYTNFPLSNLQIFSMAEA